MKIICSENKSPLEGMELGKAKLTVNGQDPENIWVKKDTAAGKMYLQNHSLAFYPFPSWGLELPIGSSFDVAEMRGESPDDTVMTVHSEAFDHIKQFLDEDGKLKMDEFFEAQEKAAAEASTDDDNN